MNNNTENTKNNKALDGKVQSILKSRKFKYGSVAVVFTVIVCAFIILLNVLLTIFSNNSGGLYLDLTGEKIYALSEESTDVAKRVEKNVEIIFCVSEDKIEDYAHPYDSAASLSYIKRLADRFASVNDRITVKYKNAVEDPLYFEKFKSKGNQISNASVIVSCEETKEYVVYSMQNFFKFSSETGKLFAYDGENKFTTALMRVALAKDKKAGIIKGHGESKRQYFEELLGEQGYNVSELDLMNVTSDELNTYDLLVIVSPTKDYHGISATSVIGGVNEIEKLDNYLKKNYGNLMVFVDSETPKLDELGGYLMDTWGVGYNSGEYILEGSKAAIPSTNGAFYGTPAVDGGYGTSISAPITAAGVDRTMFYITTPIYKYKNEIIDVSDVYTTSDYAGIIRGEEVMEVSNVPVMTLSKYIKNIDGNEYCANVLMCGSSYFLDLIGYPSGNANADVIKNALVEMGDESVVSGIDFKLVEDSSLQVTTDDFKYQILKLSTIIPAIIAVIGIVVYIKRKKS